MQPAIVQDEYLNRNPWWESGGKISDSEYYEDFQRSDFEYCYKDIINNDITLLAGPVGVGRTQTLLRTAKELVSNNVPATNIFYLPLNNPTLKIGGATAIHQAVEWFMNSVPQKSKNNGDLYLLIDEAHLVKNWSEQIATVTTKYSNLTIAAVVPTKDHVKSPNFQSNVDYESRVLLTEKFYDQTVRELKDDLLKENREIRKRCRDVIAELSKPAREDISKNVINEVFENLQPVVSQLQSSVREYSTAGDSFKYKKDENVRNLTIPLYRDVPQFSPVENKGDLHALCAIGAHNTGESIKINSISEQLGCDRRTLQKYLNVLRDFYLLTPSYQYGYERHRDAKLYLRNPAYVTSLAEVTTRGPVLNTAAEKTVYSTVVFDHCKRLSFYLNDYTDREVYYQSEDGQEIDFIILNGDDPIPISLAIERSREEAMENHEQFSSEFKCGSGIIISRENEVEMHPGSIHIPLWLFLTIC